MRYHNLYGVRLPKGTVAYGRGATPEDACQDAERYIRENARLLKPGAAVGEPQAIGAGGWKAPVIGDWR